MWFCWVSLHKQRADHRQLYHFFTLIIPHPRSRLFLCNINYINKDRGSVRCYSSTLRGFFRVERFLEWEMRCGNFYDYLFTAEICRDCLRAQLSWMDERFFAFASDNEYDERINALNPDALVSCSLMFELTEWSQTTFDDSSSETYPRILPTWAPTSIDWIISDVSINSIPLSSYHNSLSFICYSSDNIAKEEEDETIDWISATNAVD